MSPSNGFDLSMRIDATAMQVVFAFLEARAIQSWWGARIAVIEPRPGGLLAVQWEPGHGGEDALLGPLGGVLAGTLDKAMAGRILQFGSLHWLTPRGECFGPTRLELELFSKGDPASRPALLKLHAGGFQAGERWERYLEIHRRAWEKWIVTLKSYCETRAPEHSGDPVLEMGKGFLLDAVVERRRMS